MDDIEGVLTIPSGTYAVTMRLLPPVEIPVDRPPARKRESFPKTTRIRLLNAQEHRCAICRGPLGLYDSHIDHIIPLASGGSDDFTNLQLAHMSCNLRKGSGRSPHDESQERMPWA